MGIFEKYRFDPDHHLGLGDIRLTIAQQEEIEARIAKLEEALKELGNEKNWYCDDEPIEWGWRWLRISNPIEIARNALRGGEERGK